MSDDSPEARARRRRIGERLRAGLLPRYSGQRTFGGRGEGMPCACCDEPIRPADIQYDVDHGDVRDDDPAAEGMRSLPMHLPCYRLWIEQSGAAGSAD